MRVLKAPGFSPLLVGQAVNSIGNWVAIIAIWGFAAFDFDASSADLAILFVVVSVPGAILGPMLGVAVDRFGPRTTLMVSNFAGFVTALALTQAGSYDEVIVLALPLGLVEALARSSLDTLTPQLVGDDELVSANALMGAAQDSAIVTGPALAALLNSVWGIHAAFIADAATFLVGAAVAFRLDVGHSDPDRAHAAALRELRDGFGVVRRSPLLRWTLATASITYCLWAVAGILEPLYVRDVLGESDTTFALIQVAFGVGLVGAGVAVARLGDRVANPTTLAAAVVASGAACGGYFATRSLAVAYVAVFLWGVDVAFFLVPLKTLVQRGTPAEAHGRVLALNASLEPVAAVAMAPIAAALLERMGVQAVAAVACAVVACAGLLATRSRPEIPTERPEGELEQLGTSAPLVGPAPG